VELGNVGIKPEGVNQVLVERETPW